jgi:putative cell wall-binding protein
MRKARVAGALSAVIGALATLVVTATPASAATVERIAGTDRYETAAKLSAAAFTPDTSTVYVATGLSFSDALAAGPAAAKKKAPILLVGTDTVPDVTKAEIQRLTPNEIVIVGGTGAVSAGVETTLKGLVSNTRRIAGQTRFETAKAISADAFGTGVPVAYVASGINFPDALGGGAAGGALGGPILLTDTSALPAPTAAELDRLDPTSIVILGGTGAVAPAVASSAGSYGAVRRVAGPTRAATSAGVSRDTFKTTAKTVVLATGEQFPDALAGSAAAAGLGGPLLLVSRDCVSRAVNAEIDRLSPERIILLGGTTAATDAVVARTSCPDTGAKVLTKDLQLVTRSTSDFTYGDGLTINGQLQNRVAYGAFGSYPAMSMEFDLGGGYASFSATLGALSSSSKTDDGYRYEVVLDGVTIYTKELSGVTSSQAVNLNVTGGLRLKFLITRLNSGTNSRPAFGNPTVYTS